MKKILFTLLLMIGMAHHLCAQEVYTEIRRSAQANIGDLTLDPMVRKFSMFKLEALNYMAIKMREEFPDSTASLLDKEALSLNIFLSNYTQSLIASSSQPAAYQVQVIKAYMDASYSNPLFNDTDEELVLAYYMDGKSLTRFSLDTDWRRAVLAAKAAMKKLDGNK